jgi:hypothetical protein
MPPVGSPYLNAFRFSFYLLLILLVLTVGLALLGHQYEGYDPTARVPVIVECKKNHELHGSSHETAS